MRLSVIVPVYNVETTLLRCVHSILAQNVEGMEIIMVDDGSQDGSSLIAERLAAENPSVQLIRRKQNKGLSAARNIGIQSSSGDYITFVDSDDWLLERTYLPLLDYLVLHPECDILEYSVLRTINGKSYYDVTFSDATYRSARSYWINSKAFKHSYAPNKIFRREMFLPEKAEPVLFTVGKIFEDVELMSRMLLLNPVIITSSHTGYVYTVNNNGITATANGSDLRKLLETNLDIARQLNMRFMMPENAGKAVDEAEVPFYLYILNIQISVCRQLHSIPELPTLKVPLRHVKRIKMIAKVALLNILRKNTWTFFANDLLHL